MHTPIFEANSGEFNTGEDSTPINRSFNTSMNFGEVMANAIEERGKDEEDGYQEYYEETKEDAKEGGELEDKSHDE